MRDAVLSENGAEDSSAAASPCGLLVTAAGADELRRSLHNLRFARRSQAISGAMPVSIRWRSVGETLAKRWRNVAGIRRILLERGNEQT